MTWHDMTWHDMTWHDMTWHDVTWRDVTWRDVTWRDVTWRDVTGRDGTCRDVTWRDVTWRDMTRHDAAWRDVTRRDAMWRNVSWRDMTCDPDLNATRMNSTVWRLLRYCQKTIKTSKIQIFFHPIGQMDLSSPWTVQNEFLQKCSEAILLVQVCSRFELPFTVSKSLSKIWFNSWNFEKNFTVFGVFLREMASEEFFLNYQIIQTTPEYTIPENLVRTGWVVSENERWIKKINKQYQNINCHRCYARVLIIIHVSLNI